MRILIILLIFLKTEILACALCALMTPTAHIFLNFNVSQDTIEDIEISWVFSKNFTDLTLESYDFNSNSKLDKNELDDVNFAMLNYISNKNFLMNFEWYDKNGTAKTIKGNFSDEKMVMENGKIVFKFRQKVGIKIQNNRVLKTTAGDKNGFFNFTFLNSGHKKIDDNFYIEFNSNLNANFALFITDQIEHKTQKSLNEPVKQIGSENTKKPNFINQSAINSLEKLKAIFIKSAENLDIKILISVISISFLYGFFHAAGPGHAKILTTSYFLANGGNYMKSFLFSLKIGFFHVAGAFFVVVTTLFFVDLISGSISPNAIKITTQISAVMIILIAIFMFFKKIKERANTHTKECKCAICSTIKEPKSLIFNNSKFKISNNINHNDLKFKNIKFTSKNKEEWFIALASAIIPCPGTILAFLLAFNVGSYLTAFISALFMGLGMSFVIFLAAIFGAGVNKITNLKFKKLTIYIEFLGLTLMLIIGILMFLIADNLKI